MEENGEDDEEEVRGLKGKKKAGKLTTSYDGCLLDGCSSVRTGRDRIFIVDVNEQGVEVGSGPGRGKEKVGKG